MKKLILSTVAVVALMAPAANALTIDVGVGTLPDGAVTSVPDGGTDLNANGGTVETFVSPIVTEIDAHIEPTDALGPNAWLVQHYGPSDDGYDGNTLGKLDLTSDNACVLLAKAKVDMEYQASSATAAAQTNTATLDFILNHFGHDSVVVKAEAVTAPEVGSFSGKVVQGSDALVDITPNMGTSATEIAEIYDGISGKALGEHVSSFHAEAGEFAFALSNGNTFQSAAVSRSDLNDMIQVTYTATCQ